MIRALAGCAATVAAVALGVLAVDVLRAPGQISAEDARFHGAPTRLTSPWGAVDFLPGRPAERLLDVGDDLDFRRATWLFRRVQPGKVQIAGDEQPLLEALRGKAIVEIAERSRRESDPRRRAQLLNLNGVFAMSRYLVFSAFDKERYLKEAIGSFRNAVRLDPEHADARANLELALRAAKGSGIAGEDPDAGASRGQLSGTGRSGGGY
ncbi:MAG: hypothetical protein WD689_02770 [Gaiellaceae bacterium]